MIAKIPNYANFPVLVRKKNYHLRDTDSPCTIVERNYFNVFFTSVTGGKPFYVDKKMIIKSQFFFFFSFSVEIGRC